MLPVLALVDPTNQIIDQQQHADGKQEIFTLFILNMGYEISKQSWQKYNKIFLLFIGNRLISTGLEPVLIHSKNYV